MAEYSRLASGQVSSLGGPTAVILPFLPNIIEISNSTRATAASGVTKAWWSTDMGSGAAFYTTTGAGPADGTAFTTTGGFSTFQGGLALQYGPSLTITAMTKSATAPQVTTSSAHGLAVGNVVVFQNLYQSSSTGQIQLCGMPFVVGSIVDSTNFTILYNNNVSGFTALTGSPTNPTPTCKQVLYPNLYAPNVGFISALTFGVGATGTSTGNYTLVKTTAPTNFQVGQEVAFRIPSAYGSTQLNSLPDALIPGSPVYYYVTYVVPSTNGTQFVINTAGSGVTAFTTNVTFATALAGGLTFPQVVGVGDNNSGSNQFGYNSPVFYNGTANGAVSTINGPAIAGAFCNNTSQGFIIGATVAGTAADQIFWNAYMVDYNA